MAELDLITTIIVSSMSGGLSGGVGRVVSAPLDALADELRERARERLRRTRQKAEAKAGGEVHQVSDRIAMKALGEAAYNDSEIASDYLGGVLAASGPDDDSGAAIVALISRLSARQLLLHYVIYRELRRIWTGPGINLHRTMDRKKGRIRLRGADLSSVFASTDVGLILGDVVPRLAQEGLVADELRWGSPDSPEIDLEVRPTAAGASLFLWGHGVSCAHAQHLFDERVHGRELVFLADVPATPGTELLGEGRREA